MPGISRALLDFRVESGDKVLEEHFKTAPKTATYRSKTIQNQLISCCGDHIRNVIIKELREAKYFSILADEAVDRSNKEQMSLVLRYVDKIGQIKEEFVKFIECDDGISGEAMARKVATNIAELKLEMSDCRGQGYDGAGNMAGKYRGTAARIQRDHPKAVYVHCASHRLNLDVCNSCDLPLVRDMMGTVKRVSDYFNNSPKRQSCLETQIKQVLPNSEHKKLIDVCRTRWIERIDGLDRMQQLYEPVMLALEEIKDNEDKTWNSDSSSEASTLFDACSHFKYLMALVVCRNVVGYTAHLTKKLQYMSSDVLKAYNMLEVLKSTLAGVREDIDNYNKTLFDTAVGLAQLIDEEFVASKPRTNRKQTHRPNHKADTPLDYYRITLTIPFIDHLIT